MTTDDERLPRLLARGTRGEAAAAAARGRHIIVVVVAIVFSRWVLRL